METIDIETRAWPDAIYNTAGQRLGLRGAFAQAHLALEYLHMIRERENRRTMGDDAIAFCRNPNQPKFRYAVYAYGYVSP